MDIGSLIVLGKAVLEASKEGAPPLVTGPAASKAVPLECPLGTKLVYDRQTDTYNCLPEGL